MSSFETSKKRGTTKQPVNKGRASSKENKPPLLKSKRAPVEGIAQRKLVLKTSNRRDVKKTTINESTVKPSPFITKTNLYDEHWLKKQERGFTKWLNFVLCPSDEFGNHISTIGKSIPQVNALHFDEDQSSNAQQANVNFLEGLRQRKLLRWRQSVYFLFQSEPYNHVISRLEIEIEAGRILMHRDHRPHCDVGARQKLLDLLMGYNPIWLKLALEAVFGELIDPLPDHDLSQLLSVYIQSRFLSNKDINERYTHPTHTGQYGEGYIEAQSQYIIKKFLLLVLLLDKAKLTHVIDHDPCLFNPDSQIKSSREVLLYFSNTFLSGEGDLTRHLHHIGFTVTHVQMPINEFDYSVKNLAIDLQDGLRLTRLVEMFTNNWKLSEHLRVPATTKMQRLHNVEVAIKSLSKVIPLPAGLVPLNIVEGHRERTLNLLWAIIFHFQVKVNLDIDELKKETQILSQMRPHPSAECEEPHQSSTEVANVFFQSPELTALLNWCRALGKLYGIPVSNFNSSFSDGRLLCYIIHHYQPHLLPLHHINTQTTVTSSTTPHSEPVTVDNGDNENGWTATFSPTTGRNKELEKLLANEKANYKLLSTKIPLLGGVPSLTLSKDMSGTLPDEKVVITLLSYLCHQLFLLKHETRATITIQRAWRRYTDRRKQQALLVQQSLHLHHCASIVQASIKAYVLRKQYLFTKDRVCCIQRWWRGVLVARSARKSFLRLREAVIVVQSCVRRRIVLNMIERMNRAAVAIQAMFRCYSQRKRFLETKQSIVSLQTRWRATLRGKRCRQSYVALQRATITVQSNFRRVKVQRKLALECKAATTIQSMYRSYTQRKAYLMMRHSVCTIQRYWRATLKCREDREKYIGLRQSTIVIQSYYRMVCVQRGVQLQRRSAVVIQSAFRCYSQRKRFTCLKKSTLVIQEHWRATVHARKCKESFIALKQAVTTIQSHYRRLKIQRMMAEQHRAATTVQAMVRCYLQMRAYKRLKDSIRTVQVYWRSTLLAREGRRSYLALRRATVTIQSNYRRFRVQRSLARQHSAATIIQASFKSYREKKRYNSLKQSVRVLEAHWEATLKSRKCRNEYRNTRQLLILLQSHIRRWRVQKSIALHNKCATVIQAQYKSHRQRKQYLALKQSVTVIEYHWTAFVLGRKQREEYICKRKAVIRLQANIRRWLVQRRIAHCNTSAAKVQALVRMYMQRTVYMKLKRSASVIQYHWRAELEARKCRNAFISQRKAAILCQSCFRRQHTLRMIKHWQTSATRVQAWYRGRSQYRKYCTLRQSVRVIQDHWRATLLARQCRDEYLQYRRAVVRVQSLTRRNRVLKMVCGWNKSATKIQAMYRMHLQREWYLKVSQSIRVIQERWRATLLARQCRHEYLQYRTAVVRVQAHVRRVRVQRMMSHRRLCATKIQAMYRCHVQRDRYLAMRDSVRVIQYHWRATLLGRQCRGEYVSLRRAVTKLQAHYRRRRVQIWLNRLHSAAILIQAIYRGYRQWKRYTVLKHSVRVIEDRWIATLHGREAREAYRKEYRAVIVVQSLVRRWQVKRELEQWNESAIAIQSCYRGHSQRVKYVRVKEAISVVQRHWRAVLVSRECRRVYKNQRRAAILIQSCIRRWIVKRMLSIQCKAATTIQAMYKGHLQRQQYLSLQKSASVIGCYWRAILQGRQCRDEYVQYRRAVVVIQSLTRRNRVLKMVCGWNKSATRIQAMYRMHLQRKQYLKVSQSIRVIQERWKATLQARQCRDEYLQLKRAAILLQSIVRMKRVQRSLTRQHRAATLIQSVYRSHYQYRYYTVLRHSTVVIQGYWRATLQARRHRAQYISLRQTIVQLQSITRRLVVQERLATQHRAATVIQAAYKGWAQQQAYQRLRHSANVIGCYWRATLQARQCRAEYLQYRTAVVRVQAHVRRVRVQRMMSHRRLCATKIQAIYRCHVQRDRYLAMRDSVRVIQDHWRATLLGRQCRGEYVSLRRAVTKLQAHYRRRRVQIWLNRLHSAATLIQAIYRGYRQWKRYTVLKYSVRVIEDRWIATLHGREAREAYVSLRRAVTKLQAHYRRRRVQGIIEHWNTSAIVIQSVYRGHIQRQRYLNMKQAVGVVSKYRQALCMGRHQREAFLQTRHAVIVIQANYRRHKVQSTMATLNRMATIIQAQYRCYTRRRDYTMLKHSTRVIQCYWRATLLSRQCTIEYERMRQAAITLQSHYRRIWVQKELELRNNAAILVQARVRGYLQRLRYLRMKQGVATIQRYWKAWLEGKRQRAEYLYMRVCVVKVQAHIRKWLVHRQIVTQHNSAIKIQAMVRGYLNRQRYTALRGSVILIQRKWKATLLANKERRAYEDMLRSVVKAQSLVRMRLAMKGYHRLKMAAIAIQSQYRSVVVRRRYLELRGVVIMIQKAWRAKGTLRRLRELKEMERLSEAAVTIQRYWRKYREVILYKRKIYNSAIRIQSFWRGYKVRRKIRNKAIITARKRVEAANRSAKESNKLMNLLPSMLDAFLRAKYLTTASDILKTFDLMTSVSERCSILIVEGNALPVLYNFIGSSNRSIATLGIVKICLQILNNLLKWKSTNHSVVSTDDYVVCLTDLMQKVYVSQPDIALLAAILVHSSCTVRRKELPRSCHRKVASMHSILTRKGKVSTSIHHQQQRTASINELLRYLHEIINHTLL